MKQRLNPRSVLVLLLALLLSACAQRAIVPSVAGTPQSASGTPRRGGTLTMSLADGDLQSWDPLGTTDNMSIWTMLQLYDQLVRVAPDGRSVEPGLAETYTASADGKTYTFTLRQGVQFHDGTPLTVADLQYAIERGTSQASSWKNLLPPITRMTTPDDRTLVVELAEPWAPFLADLALFAFSVIPKQLHQQQGAAFFDKPVGTGPFVFDRWERGSKISLKRNPRFWDARYPYLDAVEFQVLTDDNSRMLKFSGGELDIATNVPFNQIAALQQAAAVMVQLDPILRSDLITLNHARPPFDDQQVRLAINLAINREALRTGVLFGYGQVAHTLLPPMLYWDDPAGAYPFDPVQAKAALARSSRPDGFATTLVIVGGDTVARATATIIQDQLKQIGITVAIEEVDRATLGARVTGGDFDMLAFYITSDIVDPDELCSILLTPGGGLNAVFTNFQHEQLDALIRDAARTSAADERQRLYGEIQRIYREAAVVVPLYYPFSRTALRKDVQGFKVLPTANYRLWEVWLDR